MRLIIIGGGCYGCHHTRQLLKAQRRGTIAAAAPVVVDRNPGCRALSAFAGEPMPRPSVCSSAPSPQAMACWVR